MKKLMNGVAAALICSLMVTVVTSCAVDDTPIMQVRVNQAQGQASNE